MYYFMNELFLYTVILVFLIIILLFYLSNASNYNSISISSNSVRKSLGL